MPATASQENTALAVLLNTASSFVNAASINCELLQLAHDMLY